MSAYGKQIKNLVPGNEGETSCKQHQKNENDDYVHLYNSSYCNLGRKNVKQENFPEVNKCESGSK